MRTLAFTITLALITASAANAPAGIILSSNFDGRTTTGASVSNINWVTNGVSDPGDLLIEQVPPPNPTAPVLFNGGANADRIAVNQNIEDETPWFIDIDLNVLSQSIDLQSVSLDAFILNNDGDLQPTERQVDLQLELFDNSSTLLATVYLDDVYGHGGPAPVQPRTALFDLTGNTLNANSSYTFRLTATQNSSLPQNGNNFGFDNLTISSVPEPTSVTLLAMGAFSLTIGAVRRRKQVE